MKSEQSLRLEFSSLNKIIAVSKTKPIEAIQDAMKQGYRDFGENKAQELKEKAQLLPNLTWHFIGHLQSNKVKDVVKYASYIHSVDSIKLIETIEKECVKQAKKINILIQVNLTHEDQKSGCEESELISLLDRANETSTLNCVGLMVIGPTSVDLDMTRYIFKKAKQLLTELQKDYPSLTELSMGMSQDYPIAIEEGSTMIRVGTLIFGQRH